MLKKWTNKNSSGDKNNSSRNNKASGIIVQAGSCDKNMNEPCDNDRQTAEMQTPYASEDKMVN